MQLFQWYVYFILVTSCLSVVFSKIVAVFQFLMDTSSQEMLKLLTIV